MEAYDKTSPPPHLNVTLDFAPPIEEAAAERKSKQAALIPILTSTLAVNDQAAISVIDLKHNEEFGVNENTFFQYKNLLTASQWNLLCAIAKEEKIYQPQAKQFITTYQLGTPALVKRGIDALLKKEIIFYNSGVEKPYYEVYDKYLMQWLQYK